MLWLKKHADSVSVITAVVAATWFISKLVYGIEIRSDEKLVAMEKRIDDRFVSLEKDMAVIKAVLIMKGNMPKELATNADHQ